jgi:transcriptional regulator with XRE-family HTH domain
MPASGVSPGAPALSAVGRLLRDWRVTRGMSQLDLALEAGFSTRHVSFIETGRSQPSRQALVALSEALAIPLRDRNQLLEAAGYAQLYRQTPLAAEDMSHVRGVLQFIIDRHRPYSAVVLDRYSNCLMGNEASARLLAAVVDHSLLSDHANLLRMVFHPLGARRWIVNWPEVGRHLFDRAERELQELREDRQAAALLEELRDYAGPELRRRSPAAITPADLLLPVHVRRGDVELRLFSTVMTMGTPQDVTLQELRIETLFPADEPSDRVWRRWVAEPPPHG